MELAASDAFRPKGDPKDRCSKRAVQKENRPGAVLDPYFNP
jgi:hypothetical protein